VKGPALLVFSLVALGCSNLTEVAGGVVGLDIRTPALKTIEVGETLPLSAQALDKNGNPVSAQITWRAPDPTLTVDQTGVITGISPGTGRVQAFVGSLASSLVSFTVIARADTLIVTDSLFTVGPAVAASPPLVTMLQSFSPPGPLPSWPVIYTVISPADNSVQLPGAKLVDTVSTGTDGAVSSVTLTRLNAAQPATAIVQVQSFRTRGGIVPGSGQQFTVTFQ
jgi:hypothetical protein